MFTGSEINGRSRLSSERIVVMALIAIGLMASAVLFFFDPTRVRIYPVCLFHSMTGLDCPGCGGLRATHALLHGDIAAAVHFNAMVVLSAFLTLALGGAFIFYKLQKKPLPFRWNWLWIYFAVWMAFSILRDLPIPLFAKFAP